MKVQDTSVKECPIRLGEITLRMTSRVFDPGVKNAHEVFGIPWFLGRGEELRLMLVDPIFRRSCERTITG